ncbi:MAG: hypothetical protein Q9227_002453 [Pyrenula ochraceoflavens]
MSSPDAPGDEPNKDQERSVEEKTVGKNESGTSPNQKTASMLSAALNSALAVPLTDQERNLPSMPQPGPNIEQSPPSNHGQSSYESNMAEIRVPPRRQASKSSAHSRRISEPSESRRSTESRRPSEPGHDQTKQRPLSVSPLLAETASISSQDSAKARESAQPDPRISDKGVVLKNLWGKPITRSSKKEDTEHPEHKKSPGPVAPGNPETPFFGTSEQEGDISDDIFPFEQHFPDTKTKGKSKVMTKELQEASKALQAVTIDEEDKKALKKKGGW